VDALVEMRTIRPTADIVRAVPLQPDPAVRSFLSDPALALYAELVEHRVVDYVADVAARELIERGFAYVNFDGRPTLLPEPPDYAFAQAARTEVARIADSLRLLGVVADRWRKSGSCRTSSHSGQDSSTTLTSDPSERGAIPIDLCNSATTRIDYLQPRMRNEFAQESRTAVAAPTCRTVLSNSFIEEANARGVLQHQLEVDPETIYRGADSVPMFLVVVDGRSACALVDTDLMLVTTAPALVAILQSEFDRVWNSASPLSQRSSRDLEISRLLVTGAKVATIGRRLGISERTVQRRIVAMMAATGTASRTALVAALVRDNGAGGIDRDPEATSTDQHGLPKPTKFHVDL
jgi:DNA-binding CsgD family transcriptional regulator